MVLAFRLQYSGLVQGVSPTCPEVHISLQKWCRNFQVTALPRGLDVLIVVTEFQMFGPCYAFNGQYCLHLDSGMHGQTTRALIVSQDFEWRVWKLAFRSDG